MIQLQPLVLYEVIRKCLEHPRHTEISNEFTTWTAFEGWGHGSSNCKLDNVEDSISKKYHQNFTFVMMMLIAQVKELLHSADLVFEVDPLQSLL